MGTHRKRKPKKKGKRERSAKPYPFEFRLKVVKLYLEDGYPASLISEQFGISDHSVYHWSRKYRQQGEQGLLNKARKPSGSKLPTAVTLSFYKQVCSGYSTKIGTGQITIYW